MFLQKQNKKKQLTSVSLAAPCQPATAKVNCQTMNLTEMDVNSKNGPQIRGLINGRNDPLLKDDSHEIDN